MLDNPLTYTDLKETERHLEELQVLDADDVRTFYKLLSKPRQTSKDKEHMWGLLSGATAIVKSMEEDEAEKARRVVRHFIRQYAFLIMASPFTDEYMHMEYRFCQCLIREIAKAGKHEDGIDISDKVDLTEFTVTKADERVGSRLVAAPEVTIARSIGMGLSKDTFAALSEIIAEWNARFSTHFDIDTAASSLMSLRSSLSGNEHIKQSAKVNSKQDFTNTVDDQTEDALVENFDKSEEFYNFLLNNQEVRKDLVHLLVDDLYNGLRRNEN